MKKRIQNIVLLALTSLFVQTTSIAQWAGEKVFEKVDNTKNYTTLELASMDPNLSTFVNMVTLSGLASSMSMTDAHTVFIPTNDAFRDISIERFSELTNPKNQTKLIEFIKYHTMPSKQMSYAFKDSQVMTESSPNEISVTIDDSDNIYIAGAKVIRPDINASNGVIHIVNDIIVPDRSLFFID